MATISAGNQAHQTSKAERKAKTRAALLSILAAAFLITLKAVTGWLTGSISVLASLLDSLMDIFASSVNFITVRAASASRYGAHLRSRESRVSRRTFPGAGDLRVRLLSNL